MSHVALRRVVVRLLHDPSLVDRLAHDPIGALGDADLSAAERAWLRAVPRDAWRTDPERPRRVLGALADEYPAALALAPERPTGFFRSAHFHAAVQDRGSLAIAFGHYMSDDPDLRAAVVARLELATAVVRRGPSRIVPSPAGRLRLSPHATVVRLPDGAAELLEAARSGRALPGLGQTEEPLLVARAADTTDVAIERLEEPLAALLERATQAVPASELARMVVALGGDPGDAPAVVQTLVDDRLLV